MSASDRIEATAKNIEGKVKEVLGNVTGDGKTEAEGKAKQVEAKAGHAKEDVKDGIKDVVQDAKAAVHDATD